MVIGVIQLVLAIIGFIRFARRLETVYELASGIAVSRFIIVCSNFDFTANVIFFHQKNVDEFFFSSLYNKNSYEFFPK